MVEVLLELLRSAALLGVACFLLAYRKKTAHARHSGYRLILAGFLLLAFGTLLDTLGSYIHLALHEGELPAASLLMHPGLDTALRMVSTAAGYLLGPLFIFLGVGELLPALSKLEQVQEALREREERYHSLITSLPAAVYRGRLDTQWVMDYISQPITEICGYPQAEFTQSRSYTAIIHPADLASVTDTLRERAASAQSYELEYRIRHRDGDLRWVYDSGRAFVDAREGTLRTEGVILDITALKLAQEHVKRSEQRYRSVVEDQEEFIVRWLPDGTRTFVNDSYCRYFGVTREALIGSNFFDDLPVEECRRIRDKVRRLTPGNPVAEDTHRVAASEGQTRWQHWIDRALFDETGRLTEFQSVGRDVTTEKCMEQALKESEERYRAFILNSNEGIFRIDIDEPVDTQRPREQQAREIAARATLVEANDAFAQIYGYTKDEVIGLPLSRLVPEAEITIARFVESQYRLIDIEDPIVTRDGRRVWTAYSVIGQLDEGRLFRIWGTQRDITERRQNDALIFNISRGVAAETGENFFRSLIKHLSKVLNADYAFIAETVPDRPGVLQTITVCKAGEHIDNFECQLTGTPCEEILDQGLFSIPQNAQARYPDNKILARFDAQAYIGSVLRDSAGRALGMMVVLFQSPIESTTRIESLLQIFASRASAELERRQAQRDITQSEERYRAYIANSFNGIIRFDLRPGVPVDLPSEEQIELILEQASIAECNDQAARIRGYERAEQIIGDTLHNYARPEYLRAGISTFIQADYRLEKLEVQAKRVDTQVIWLEVNAVGYVEDGKLVRIWSTHRDITERKRDLAELEHRATHDTLTGLPNREYLHQRVEQLVIRANDANEDEDEDEDRGIALMLMDLNHFKEINDTLGHHSGDTLLKEIAPRLRPLLTQSGATLARLGGDEFAVLLPESGVTHAEQTARSLLAALRQPFNIEGLQVEISASIGISIFPAHGRDSSTLMRCADVAMYVAKDEVSGYRVYHTDLDIHTPRRLTLMTELGNAIRTNQLLMHYQAKVDMRTHTVHGFEALLRWDHPRHGLIPPAQFVPLAELGELIQPMTHWVLEHGIRQCREWRDQGVNTTVAMNLSTRNLLDNNCALQLQTLLREYDIDPRAIELEITESALMKDPERALRVLNQIHDLGVCLAIDDFGTGFSSLNYLRRMPIHALKIDLTFVRNMLENPQDAIIVNSIINLAESLELKVIAEGVENPAILHALKDMGCDYAQGYYISKPLGAQEIFDWQQDSGWAVGS